MGIYIKIAEEGMSFEESIAEGCKIWKGVAANGTYNNLIHELPLRLGAKEAVAILKERGYIVGCISSGVSQFFMEPFSQRLDLDFAYSNVLGEEDGTHNGEVKFIMGSKQKAETALELLSQIGLDGKHLASIGDGSNDIDLFRVSGFSIAFNPQSDAVSEEASVTVRSKDLRSVLEYF